MDGNTKTIGDRIKELREKAALTQEELAKQVNTTKQTIYKYENNIVTNIPSDKIEFLAQALQTTPTYLMGWEEDEVYVSRLCSEADSLLSEVDGCMDGDIKDLAISILRKLNTLFAKKREIEACIHLRSTDPQKIAIRAIEALNYTKTINMLSSGISQDTSKICELITKKAIINLGEPFDLFGPMTIKTSYKAKRPDQDLNITPESEKD